MFYCISFVIVMRLIVFFIFWLCFYEFFSDKFYILKGFEFVSYWLVVYYLKIVYIFCN